MTTATAHSQSLKILPRPHSQGQRDMVFYPGSYAAFCGRRYGKTLAGVERILVFAINDPGLYWWVGLSWRSASMKRAWRLLKYFARKIWKATGLKYDGMIREQDKEIILPNGARIWLRTAENPESLAGEGIKGVVGDEFTLWQEVVWTEYLEATLLDYGGWAAFFGVPKGNNWASVLWHNALTRNGWRQFHFTTYDNPHIDERKIKEIKDNSTERIFSQEYLAQVLSDGGAVFRNIAACATLPVGAMPQPQGDYLFGMDWAKDNDFTAIAVINRNTRHLVHVEHFNGVKWSLQRGRLRAMYDMWKPSAIWAEENSVGSPNIEALQDEGLPVISFMTTGGSKGPLIESLALAFERSEIAIVNDPVLVGELQAYTLERLPSGRYRYNAPSGMHDDCVIAAALAWHGCSTRQGWGNYRRGR